MELETKQFINNVDEWIKQIRSEFCRIKDMSNITEENVGNIEHNYELIHDLKDEIESLKKEVKALKVIGLVNLKVNLKKN